ncbi:MAG: phosphoenolpyruvate carboxykinase (ATP) [Leptolyngbya sp. DLM2.Bin15]|nr:MAG: phosphoenolpyruvate carboxykinase (ATP) [Leptolyngbya sp. DLM2.Bin15]
MTYTTHDSFASLAPPISSFQDQSLTTSKLCEIAQKSHHALASVRQPWSAYQPNPTDSYGLADLGMKNLGNVYRNLPVAQLIEHALIRGEGILADNGALCVKTGSYMGRSPHDKFIVDDPEHHAEIHWDDSNVPISELNFQHLYQRILSYVQGRDLYIFDGFVGADLSYRMGVRVITELASESLFSHQIFLRPSPLELASHHADFTVIAVPGLKGDPDHDGIHSEAFIVIDFSKRLVIIGGSRYAGEIKKSVFSLMNYVMAKQGVLPMHCAANRDAQGHTALFFGLSGTGKTTLASDPERFLIGDDEHGWSEEGIFNFEGGCYAKTSGLSKEHEPQIWQAIRSGALLENVILRASDRSPDYDDNSLTDNTRVAYPLDYIPNHEPSGLGNHPNAVIFLTADAFGVLPPIAKLTSAQAMYHFLSGYTSKLSRTEQGMTEPQVTFSACFGKPFLPLAATLYAEMLGDRLRKHHFTATVFLVNTGWFGGPYGVGQRIAIRHTRAMVSAALKGELNRVTYHAHPIFKIFVPDRVPGVPRAILDPRKTWADVHEYDQQARMLARRFIDNFAEVHGTNPELLQAGPTLEPYS